MSILIVGATGMVGGEIARMRVSPGTQVAGLVRGGTAHPKASQLAAAGIEIVEGDLCEPQSLARAVRDRDGVICTATSMPTGADDGLRRVDREGTLALIDAAETAGVKKFVYVSYSGNIREDCPLETAKRDCENRLLAGAMEAVILRPSYFMEMWLSPVLGFDPANHSVRIYGSGKAKVSYISAFDVAEFAAVAAKRKYPNEHTILEMGGPEALSQIEVVEIFERALNASFRREFVTQESLEDQTKSTDPLQKTFAALMLAYAKGDVVDGAAVLAREHALSLRSVVEYTGQFLSAAKASAAG